MMAATKPWTGRTLLWWLLGFFAVVFAVNGVFLWYANSSWTGLSAEDSYRRGLDYNRVIEQAESQAALGWTVETGFTTRDSVHGRLEISVTGPDGSAISHREVTAYFRRPVVEGLDFKASLVPQTDGSYAVDVTLPAPGQWDVRLEVSRPGTENFVVETRVWSK